MGNQELLDTHLGTLRVLLSQSGSVMQVYFAARNVAHYIRLVREAQ